MNLVVLPKANELLDNAFRKARKQAAMLKSQRNRLKDAKGKNIRRIEVSGNYFLDILQKTVQDFPSVKGMHPFYRQLAEATIDTDAVLKALGHMTAERKIILRLKRQHIGRVKALERGQERNAAGIATEFYGRLGSLVKKLDKSIGKYNEAARKMREFPSIQFGLATAIIAGFPNTGKSTVLGRLSKSKPKVAAYPFTTQKLEIGYLVQGYKQMQLIDTPGLLDRSLEERNRVERKAIAALRHLADAIIFVADPTRSCGFEIGKQFNLLKELKQEFKEIPFIVVINKADAANSEEMQAAKKLFGENAIVAGEGIKNLLGKRVGKLLEKV